MSLSSYSVFAKIVESGSLAKAAQELHLSPSAVSKQLSGLEQRLGAKLIQRSTRSIQVTEIGERFYQRCQQILCAVTDAETEVKELASEAAGRLRVTLPQSLATAHFASLIHTFQARYPAITVDLGVSNSIVNLIENKVDVAFRAGALDDSRLIATELFRAEIVLCGSPAYFDAHPVPRSLTDLKSHRLLVPSEHYIPTQWRPRSRGSAQQAHWSVCEDINLLVESLKLGAGVGLLWEQAARSHLEQGELVAVASPIEHAPRPVNMIHLSRDYLPKRVAVFLGFFREHFRQ